MGHQCFLRGCGLPWGREGAGVTRLSSRLYFLQPVTSAGGACAGARAAKPGKRDQGRPVSAASARLQGRSVEPWSQQGGSVPCRRAQERELQDPPQVLACWARDGGEGPNSQPPQEALDWCHWLLGEAHQIQPTPAADNGPRPQGRKLGHAGELPGEPALPGTASPCGGESGLFRCPPQLGSDSQPHPSYWLSCHGGEAAPLHVTRWERGRRTVPSPGFLICALQKSSKPGVHHPLCVGAPWASGQMGGAPALTQGPPGSLPTAPSHRAPSPSASCQVPAARKEAKEPMGPWQAQGRWCPGEAAPGKGPPCVPSVFHTCCSLFSCLSPGSCLRPRPCGPGVADVE